MATMQIETLANDFVEIIAQHQYMTDKDVIDLLNDRVRITVE